MVFDTLWLIKWFGLEHRAVDTIIDSFLSKFVSVAWIQYKQLLKLLFITCDDDEDDVEVDKFDNVDVEEYCCWFDLILIKLVSIVLLLLFLIIFVELFVEIEAVLFKIVVVVIVAVVVDDDDDELVFLLSSNNVLFNTLTILLLNEIRGGLFSYYVTLYLSIYIQISINY